MRVTVAICTWNRAPLLRRTLDGMTHLKVPPGIEWEVLVVNNRCTDDTDTVLASYVRRLPMRRLFQHRLGLSHARNLAVQEATGRYILWTDDDVAVGPDWLAAYHAAFSRFPDAALFGGPVLPWFAARPPAWLRRAWPQAALYYAIRDCPPEPAITPVYVPFGANLAIRTDMQVSHPYDPALGRRGGDLLSGEDAQMVRTILQAGGTGWWVPRAVVRHYLPRERLTIRYLRRVIGRGGEAGASVLRDAHAAHVFGRPVWLWKKSLKAEVQYRVHRVRSTPDVWFPYLRQASFCWGQLRGYAVPPRDGAIERVP